MLNQPPSETCQAEIRARCHQHFEQMALYIVSKSVYSNRKCAALRAIIYLFVTTCWSFVWACFSTIKLLNIDWWSEVTSHMMEVTGHAKMECCQCSHWRGLSWHWMHVDTDDVVWLWNAPVTSVWWARPVELTCVSYKHNQTITLQLWSVKPRHSNMTLPGHVARHHTQF